MIDAQKTIKSPVTISGIGLHTGETVTLTIKPAPENKGYRFCRTDLEGHPMIKADVDNVINTERGTTLEQNGVRIYTTEHVLAAIYGLEIDNAVIELNGPEIPILDGSAQPFVEAILAAGIQDQEAEKNYFYLKTNLKFEDEQKQAEILAVPDEQFRITVMVDYNSPLLGTQHATMYNIKEFSDEISSCRTFVFLREIQELHKRGLIKGGDVNNAIVMVDRKMPEKELQELRDIFNKPKVEIQGIGMLNNVSLRYENEPARHKLLDIVGDMALVGRPIKAHILAARPGHSTNTDFARLLKEMMKKERKSIPSFDLSKKPAFGINDIMKLLPHRYPFLLIDKILELSDNHVVGLKNITFNEPFFQGHFPGNPVMPGVLLVEAMAQTGGILALNTVSDPENYLTYFLKIDNVKFKQMVKPGDTVIYHLKLLTPIRRGIVHMAGTAYVNEKVVAEGEMMAQIVKVKNDEAAVSAHTP